MEGPIKQTRDRESFQEPGMDRIRNTSLPSTNAPRRPAAAQGIPNASAMTNGGPGPSPRGAGIPAGDPSGLYDAAGGGRGKICTSCGRIMKKSTRMILSPFASFAVIVLGGLLMFVYGMATNFYQVPWSVKFALPAAYYVGSIFVGLGILFFFIREKVWYCQGCRAMDKR
ncbi:MAG: hypothetical protein HY914_06150 [Desulfomonile tiedjei]|nr:hypothetical protein [Desulfomonile tiedjei]